MNSRMSVFFLAGCCTLVLLAGSRVDAQSKCNKGKGGGPNTGSPGLQQGMAYPPAFQRGMPNPYLQQRVTTPYVQQGMTYPYVQQGMMNPYLQQGMMNPYAQQQALIAAYTYQRAVMEAYKLQQAVQNASASASSYGQ